MRAMGAWMRKKKKGKTMTMTRRGRRDAAVLVVVFGRSVDCQLNYSRRDE